MSAFIRKSAGEEKDITWPYGLEANLSFEANRLKTAIKLANKKVFKAADNREEYTGMGTTVVAALVAGNVLTVGSAGDSRCYARELRICSGAMYSMVPTAMSARVMPVISSSLASLSEVRRLTPKSTTTARFRSPGYGTGGRSGPRRCSMPTGSSCSSEA